MKKVLLTFLIGLSFNLQAQLVDEMKDESKLYAETKQINQFIRRFNGEEDEKYEFSFSLLDLYDTGYFDFEEFREIISKIIAHWCIMTGS